MSMLLQQGHICALQVFITIIIIIIIIYYRPHPRDWTPFSSVLPAPD